MIGASGTAYAVPSEARSAYGTMPVSAQAFLRLVLDAPTSQGETNHDGMDHGQMDPSGMDQGGMNHD